MDREDLFISLKQVRVRYEFTNHSNGAISTTVAFPIPTIQFDELIGYRAPLKSDNFMDFQVRANGALITPQKDARATQGGTDITQYFAERGLSVVPFGWKEAPTDAPVSWAADIKYYWPQVFPVGRTIIEHTYKPIVGAFPFFSSQREYAALPKTYCADRTPRMPWWRQMLWEWYSRKHSIYTYAKDVHYILKTANNWRGPIGEFHLTIEVPSRFADLLSCIVGLERTGARTYELQRKNFTPDRDLDLLILGD